MHSVRSGFTWSAQCFRLWRRVCWGCTLTSITILGAVLLLDALCDGLVCPLSQLQQTLTACVCRLQGLNESGPARGGVRVAMARLAVSHDMGALRTAVGSAMLADVRLRDSQCSRRCSADWLRLCNLWSVLLEPHAGSHGWSLGPRSGDHVVQRVW